MEIVGRMIDAKGRVEAEGFDYQAEADATCSIVWNPQYVAFADFRRNLQMFVEIAGILNLYKKLLFRGKTPGDVHMRMPEHGESLDGHGGHINGLDIDLVHGIVGLATESGEAVEILLNMLDGKVPDRINAIEESGDCRWYINRILRWAGATDEQCERANIDKLHGRGHAKGLDVFADANRDLQRERLRLEALVDAPEPAPTLPLGPHGDEEPDGFVTVHPPFVRRPIGGCEGMDC